jgi:hypothetical protein
MLEKVKLFIQGKEVIIIAVLVGAVGFLVWKLKSKRVKIFGR